MGHQENLAVRHLLSQPVSELAAACNHPQGTHQSIAGIRDEHGVYLSRGSATYPPQLAAPFAQKISVLLTPLNFSICWDSVFSLFPKKDWFQNPKSFVDGGGLFSRPDWSMSPTNKENLFRAVRLVSSHTGQRTGSTDCGAFSKN